MHTARVAIIGAGQLGRMLALAGYPLGIHCSLLDGQVDSPGGQVAGQTVAALDDTEALQEMARSVDVLTFEIENVSVDALRRLESIVPVYPPPAITAKAQDRLSEKLLFGSLGIPTARFVAVDTDADLAKAAQELGWPIVLKARRLGYDGRGQRIVSGMAELRSAWSELGPQPAIAEAWVDFARELSLIGARGADGACVFYPLTENRHEAGILRSSLAPYEDDSLQATAEEWLGAIMSQFDYRGVLTVEFFATHEGLVANEMAPRVHNSGHWTIEGAVTSQFENHLRAVLGWPLGDPSARSHSGMLNLLGRVPPLPRLLELANVRVHYYGKAPRPSRKVGHCTVTGPSRSDVTRQLAALEERLTTET